MRPQNIQGASSRASRGTGTLRNITPRMRRYKASAPPNKRASATIWTASIAGNSQLESLMILLISVPPTHLKKGSKEFIKMPFSSEAVRHGPARDDHGRPEDQRKKPRQPRRQGRLPIVIPRRYAGMRDEFEIRCVGAGQKNENDLDPKMNALIRRYGFG